MAQENKLIRWANDRFPPIDLNNEIKPLIELIGKVKELEERNKVLEDALKGIIDNWTERMSGDIEVWKDPSSSVSSKGYYSPSASLVSSEFIAKGREALSNNQK